MVAVTVRRQGGGYQVAGHGAEMKTQRLNIRGPWLIRELHEDKKEYPSGLTIIQLIMLDAASFL